MKLSNVVVVAQGGIGTLLELFYAWQLMQVEHICNTPIILLGDMWPGLIQWIEENPLKRKMLDDNDMLQIFLADHNHEAMKIIKKAHQDFQNDPNYCWNYRRYSGFRI
jgi:predicted Rossmann-fold nucleotide-binding protein